MRDIKFRAWTGKEYRYPPPIGEWDWEDCNLFAGYNKKPIIFEQYIGLKDDSGVEIYEGDILQWENVTGYEDGVGFVEWEQNPCAYYLVNDENNIFDTIYDFTPYLEIIGNIHENQELLEDRKK